MITLVELRKRKPKNGILYLNKKEFREYVKIVSDPEIFRWMGIVKGMWDEKAHKAKKKKILKEGKGLWFRGIPVERKNG